jgi:hypothetical protein
VVFGEAANITSVPTATSKLVLLPGMDGTGELFDSFVKALPQKLHGGDCSIPPKSVSYFLGITPSRGFQCLRFRAVCAHSGIVLLTSGNSVGGYQSAQPQGIGDLRRIHDQPATWGASINLPAPVALLFLVTPLRVQSSYCSLGAMRHPRWWLL